MKANLTSMFLGKHGQRSAAVLSAVLSAMAVLPAAAAENYIPGAQNTPSSLPLYLNNPDMYYPDAVGGVCWATANTDIFAYWDRNAYNGVIYWNLVDNGTAPQREPALPTAPGHEQGDVQSVVNWLAHQYYGLERGDEAAILTEFANDSNGLSFTISYHGPADTTSAKTSLFNIMKAEIDAGRPFSAGSWGTYFGGAHQVPVMGYKEMANIADSTIYIHRNTGGTGTEYVNFFASAWDTLDMDKIVPGGTPVDQYEALGDNTAATAVTIEPDDVYGFRQTHNFSFAGDADWIGLNAVAGRKYTMATRSLGASCDTVLQLYSSNGTTMLAQDDDGGEETGASEIEWDSDVTGTVYLRVTEKTSRAGHAAKYDIQVSHDGAVVPPGVIDLQNGVAVANLSEAQGSTAREYRLAVPAGATGLQISISGGSGDCDMYVKFGSRATQSNYDYRPYVGGNNETVTVSNPSVGDWYIMLHGFSAYSGVTLQASYTPPPTAPAITTSSPLPSGTAGAAYSVTLAASGGTTPYSWSLASGSLPAGLSLSGGGVISGTPTASGTSSFTVRVTGGNSLSSTQAFSLTIGTGPVTVSLPTALDAADLTFTTGGSAIWFGQTATAHDGVDAAQSGVIGHSQSTYMETTVSGPGTLSFWWKVSSESNWDWLRFYIDGAEQAGAISGSLDWQQKSYTIPSGNHTLKWQYAKDASVSSGSDCGWVDQVVWTRSTYYTLTVHSSNPDSGVVISSTTGHGGTTDYPKTVSAGETINLEAPEFVGSGASRKRFVAWDSNCWDNDTIRNKTFQYDTECGDENGNMWVCANYEDAPESGGYLCDPAGDDELETVGTYDGYLYASRAFGEDGVPAVLGTVNVKLSKLDGRLTAKAVVQAGTVSFSGKAWTGPSGDGSLFTALTTRGGETLDLFVRQNRIWGTVSGGKFGAGEIFLEGSRTRFADKKDPEAQAVLNRYKGYYTASLFSTGNFFEGYLDAAPQGHGYLTLTVNAGGKVRIAGMLADGTGVSQSAQLLHFADCGEWLCVPFFVPLYRKTGSVSALLWIDPETRGIYCGAETGESVRWEKPGAGPDGFSGLLELWGGPYNQKTPLLQAHYVFESALDWDLATYHHAGGAEGCAFAPEWLPVTVSGSRMAMPRAGQPVRFREDGETWYEYDGDNPAGATLSFTARTGIFKGKFKLYYDYYDQNERFQHKTVSVPYAGVMLQDPETGTLTYGAGHALFPTNDPELKPYRLKRSFPVWISSPE